MAPIGHRMGAAKTGILASILSHYQAKSAQKRSKMGQNQRFTVTYQ
jgi:hypothetical protein